MLEFIKKRKYLLNGELSQQEKLRINVENEYLAMSCGSFNPQFLAKIKRSMADKKSTV
ncbi:MAG: hypothetical protein JSW45_09990 [Thiotrichales bacterium]|nr:MAG: hypothetical protein JSW45_09990 [Thiotrichales bacterium]